MLTYLESIATILKKSISQEYLTILKIFIYYQ